MARVFRIIGAALSLFLFFAGAFPAFAQQQTPQTVSVRASAQGDHVRVVFDWPQGPGGYTLAEEKGRGLVVAFNGAATFDFSAGGPLSGSVYNGAEIRSADPPTVFVKTGKLKRFRHFRAGNRVIVDLYGTEKSAGNSKPVSVVSAEKEESPVASPPQQKDKKEAEDKKEKSTADSVPAPVPAVAAAPSMPAAPAVAVASERLPRPALEPHIINFTTTEAVGMAAFERGGALWLVFDRPDLQPAPQIAGPQKNLFPPFERIALTGGTAFRLQMPGDALFYAEGSGLVWKIVVTPSPREVIPVQAVRGKDTLFWPMTHARRALEVPDPAIGDTLRVVTVSRAGDFSGLEQSFVELDALPSSLGLALAPRVDDLAVSVAEGKGVTVSRPKGLSLSDGTYRVPGTLPEPEDVPLPQRVEEPAPELDSKQTSETPPDAAQKSDGNKSGETLAPPAASSPDSPPPPEPVVKDAPEEKAPEPEKGEPTKESGAPVVLPSPAVAAAATLPSVKEKRIFDFQEWTMGGQSALRANKRLMMLGMAGKDEVGKVEDLLSLAKMYLANGWGAEALGYLNIVTQILPELEANPRFVALRGAARVLAGKYESALKDFLNPVLGEYDDVNFWRAYTLARLQDWRQASERIPKDFRMLESYPSFLRDDMGVALAEIALRAGNAALGEDLLGHVGKGPEPMRPGQDAARDYLRAEILRQKGEKDKAAAAFETLAKGRNRQFRARAGLALTNLLIESKKIDTKEAAERLERLRFSWRGDEFEPLVNYRLGALYLEDGQYTKGLSILRDTVEEAPGNGLTEQITNEMLRSFHDIFMTEKLDKLSPLDAITLYEDFRELVPPGAEGDKLAERLAEHLAVANLYGRAGDILEYQLTHTLKGADAVRTAVRLAAIRLLDGRPEAAIAVLDHVAAGKDLDALDDAARKEKIREMALLRARALSKMDKPEQALGILNAMPPDADVNRLRVDISWGAGNWDEAAQAMQDIILDEDIPPRGPIKPDQAILLLNRAVALNLADNRVALANMRERFGTAMNATDKGKLFDVITRPRQNSVLADRQTLTGVVSEVDMFKSFLETVREK